MKRARRDENQFDYSTEGETKSNGNQSGKVDHVGVAAAAAAAVATVARLATGGTDADKCVHTGVGRTD